MGEIQWGSRPVVLALLREFGDLELGIFDDEYSPGANSLGCGNGAMIIIDAKAGEELNSMVLTSIDEDLQRLYTGI